MQVDMWAPVGAGSFAVMLWDQGCKLQHMAGYFGAKLMFVLDTRYMAGMLLVLAVWRDSYVDQSVDKVIYESIFDRCLGICLCWLTTNMF